MPTLISGATGNFTANTTWKAASAVASAEVDSEAATFDLSTGNSDSTTFTPAATQIDGIGIKIQSLVTPTGTVTITLRNNNNSSTTSVTVNASDLPANGWFLVSFAGVTPNGTHAYHVRITRSVADSSSNRIRLYASTAAAANMSRVIRLNTTNTPAANDKLFFIGEHTGAGTGNSFTITNDNTATTSFGPTVSGGPPDGAIIAKRATFTWGTSASTNYYLKLKGKFCIYDGGTMNIGTSGTRMPSTSTATLHFDVVANVDSGLYVNDGGTLNNYGHNGRLVKTTLSADEAAAQTVLSVTANTGWADGDIVVIGATAQGGYNQSEKRTIAGSGVGAGTITVTSGLTYAHSGTDPTKAIVVNLTRNVKIIGTSVTLCGYVYFAANSTVNVDYVEYQFLGSATANKYGIDIYTTTGTCSITNCSLRDFFATATAHFYIPCTANSTSITLQYNAIFVDGSQAGIIYVNNSTNPLTTGILIDSNYQISSNLASYMYLYGTGAYTVSNNIIVGGIYGYYLQGASALGLAISFTDNLANSIYYYGINVVGAATLTRPTCYGMLSHGIFVSMGQLVVIDTPTIYGCSSAGIGNDGCPNLIVTGGTLGGITGQTQGAGIGANSGFTRCFGVDFGASTGRTAHVTADVQVLRGTVVLNNCLLRTTAEVDLASFYTGGGYVFSTKHDQTAGSEKAWCASGKTGSSSAIIRNTSTVYSTNPSSLEMRPNVATTVTTLPRLDSGNCCPGKGFLYPVANGATLTPKIQVRKDGSYAGDAPRLILKRNDAIGITADVVLDSLSVGANTWEELTGTTAAATADGVMEIVVDCNGIAGSVFIGQWGL
jgi:hypothetical protein